MINKEQLISRIAEEEGYGPAELTMDQLNQVFGGDDGATENFRDTFVDDTKSSGPVPTTPFQDVTWPPKEAGEA